MEYLMTYGWAILIIAVVLGVLYYLGIFNSANLAPKLPPGSCQVVRPDGPGTTQNINTEGECLSGFPEFASTFNALSQSSVHASVPVSQGLTVSLWIDIPAVGTTFTPGAIIYQGVPFNVGDLGWGILTLDSYFYFYYAFNGVSGPATVSYTVSEKADTWENLVFTLNSSGTSIGSIYVNGEQAAGGVGTSPLVTSGLSSYPVQIGCPQAIYMIYYNCFNGELANIQIYNTSMGASAVNSLYLEGIGGVPEELSNLVAWWPLNGNANDYSGNEYNGAGSGINYLSSWNYQYNVP